MSIVGSSNLTNAVFSIHLLAEDWIEFLDDSGAIIEETDTAG